jgi:hypothetical protein
MILFLESDISAGAAFPEVSAGDFVRPRGLVVVGGPPIAGRLPKNLTFYVHDGEASAPGLTDFMRGVGFILISKKLREVLESVKADVEYVPVMVRYMDHNEEGYFVANPLRRIHGVDLTASVLELDEAGIALTVDKLVIDEARFTDVPIAVVHETLHIAVQDDVAAAIRAAGCTGCSFISPASVQF